MHHHVWIPVTLSRSHKSSFFLNWLPSFLHQFYIYFFPIPDLYCLSLLNILLLYVHKRLPECTYACASCVCLVFSELRREHQTPGTGVTDGWEPTCECWELILPHFQEQQVQVCISGCGFCTCECGWRPEVLGPQLPSLGWEANCWPISLAPDKGASDSRLQWILWLQWPVQTNYALPLKLSLSSATANTFTHCFRHFIFLVLTLGFHKCKKGSQIQKIPNSFVVFKKIHENKSSWEILSLFLALWL